MDYFIIQYLSPFCDQNIRTKSRLPRSLQERCNSYIARCVLDCTFGSSLCWVDNWCLVQKILTIFTEYCNSCSGLCYLQCSICYKLDLSIELQNYVSDILSGFTITGFFTCFLPFITVQMIGASGDELSAAVDWWIWSGSAAYFLYMALLFILSTPTFTVVSVFISYGSVALISASVILFKHWLVIYQRKHNPLLQVFQVLNYARKSKHPRNCSALTYWEEGFPSRIDLGKDKVWWSIH